MMLFIAGTFYISMVLTGNATELKVGLLHVIPTERAVKVVGASISWNYTSILNIIFILLAGAVMYRFVRSIGIPMLKMMHGESMPTSDHHH